MYYINIMLLKKNAYLNNYKFPFDRIGLCTFCELTFKIPKTAPSLFAFKYNMRIHSNKIHIPQLSHFIMYVLEAVFLRACLRGLWCVDQKGGNKNAVGPAAEIRCQASQVSRAPTHHHPFI